MNLIKAVLKDEDLLQDVKASRKEKTGFNLWSSCQECERWTLLTKNNYGHSTITVNNELFINNGTATLLDFKAGDKPEATFNMKAVYGENIKSASALEPLILDK